jgi:hypothetical protein
MKSAIVNLVIGLGQLLNAYYQAPDRESVELISAITRWLEKHKDSRK